MTTMLSCVSLVFDAYEKIAEVSIEDSIKSELSGDFERLMLAAGKKNTRSTTPLRFHSGLISCLFNTVSASDCVLTVQCIRSVPMFFAKRLYKSMKVKAQKSFGVLLCFVQTNMFHL